MPNLKGIKTKITSVGNLRKMTKALEVVSTVKLQRVKKKTENFKLFVEDFLRIISVVGSKIDLFGSTKTFSKKELVVIVSSDKGLCGGLNSKIFKNFYTECSDKANIDVFCIGKKALEFCVRTGYNVVGNVTVKEDCSEDDLISLIEFVKNGISEKTYGGVKIYFNYFKNVITQLPTSFTIFPLTKEGFQKFGDDLNIDLNSYVVMVENKDLTLEPSSNQLKKELLNQLISYMMYGAILQNQTGEFAARMVAMKNASDNAKSLVDKFTLVYNKARQSIVTQEISEIVSAKSAIEN